MDFLSWVALAIIIFLVVSLVYGIVAVHDVPYEIARARNHPHKDAIQAGGWVSLFTLHAIWPLLWVWAFAYDRRGGYAGSPDAPPDGEVATLRRRVAELEAQLADGGSGPEGAD